MRENCTSGSVRGTSGNTGSYRKRPWHHAEWWPSLSAMRLGTVAEAAPLSVVSGLARMSGLFAGGCNMYRTVALFRVVTISFIVGVVLAGQASLAQKPGPETKNSHTSSGSGPARAT
jgi:hypothetical protein